MQKKDGKDLPLVQYREEALPQVLPIPLGVSQMHASRQAPHCHNKVEGLMVCWVRYGDAHGSVRQAFLTEQGWWALALLALEWMQWVPLVQRVRLVLLNIHLMP